MTKGKKKEKEEGRKRKNGKKKGVGGGRRGREEKGGWQPQPQLSKVAKTQKRVYQMVLGGHPMPYPCWISATAGVCWLFLRKRGKI